MELSPREKTLAAIGVTLGVFLSAIEATVVATSMPTAAQALGGLAIIHYVFVAYQLATTVTIVVWGKLADSWGLRRSYIAGCAFFLVGSALCGMAQSMNELIIFRFIQGIGAGALYPLAQTTLGALFTHAKRANMQVYISIAWAFASFAGPPLGALIATHFSWRWVFYINLPAGIISLILFTRGLARYKDGVTGTDYRFDWRGSLLLTLIIFTLVFSVSVDKTGHLVLGPKTTAILIALALGLLALFINHIKKIPHPFISPSILANPVFAKAGMGSFFMCMAMFGTISFLPLIAQIGFHQNILEAGHTLTIFIIGWLLASAISPRAYLKFTLATLTRCGMGLLTLIYGFLALKSNSLDILTFRVSLFFLGIAMGICFAPLLLGVQASLERKELGQGTSAFQLLRTMGGTLGVSLLGAIFTSNLEQNTGIHAQASIAKFFLADTVFSLFGLVSMWKL